MYASFQTLKIIRSSGEFSNYCDSQVLVNTISAGIVDDVQYSEVSIGDKVTSNALTTCVWLLAFIIEGNAEFQLDVKNRDCLFPFKLMDALVKSPHPKGSHLQVTKKTQNQRRKSVLTSAVSDLRLFLKSFHKENIQRIIFLRVP